jgi:hypothetical protein
MSVVISNQTAIAYVFVALLGLIILRRAYRLTQGVPISTGRLLVLPAVYVLLYVAELAAIGYGGFGSSVTIELYVSYAVDAALVVAGIVVAYGYTLQHLEIYRPEGTIAWSYRMSPLLPVLYVVLFFVRIGIETAILNESPFVFPVPGALAGISVLALYLLFTVDALWGLSTGFLVGRSVAVYREWRAKLATPGAAPGPALP